jgi:hypothetical protein
MPLNHAAPVIVAAIGMAISAPLAFGQYTIVTTQPGAFIPGVDNPANLVPGSQDDDAAIQITFPVTYMNALVGAVAWVTTNGRMLVFNDSAYLNAPLTTGLTPGYYPMWDDLDLRTGSANATGLGIEGMYKLDTGSRLVIQWNGRPYNLASSGTPAPVWNGVMFKVQLQIFPAGGPIVAQYVYQGLGSVSGQSATVGFVRSEEAVQHSHNTAGSISDATVVTIMAPPEGACCFSDGWCLEELTVANCIAQGGVYLGDNTECWGQCPQPWNEPGDAGDLPATAAVPSGTGPLSWIVGSNAGGGDVDMYRIQICDHASFSASTVANAEWDTQLFLFSAAGVGVAANDDVVGGTSLQSRLTSQYLPAHGEYLLAISGYNRDPVSGAGALIFNPPIPRAEIPANGPGAPAPVNAWVNTSLLSGAYAIALTGACRTPTTCYANCDASTTAPVLNVGDFTCFLQRFAAGESYANCDQSTTAPVLNVGDFTCFLQRFAAGCP